MSIKSIVIDNKQTKAQRIAPDKVQLDIVALPLDGKNRLEKNVSLQLYINDSLLGTLQPDINGKISSTLLVGCEKKSFTLYLQTLQSEVKSEIKRIMIDGGLKKEVDKKSGENDNLFKGKQEILAFVAKNGWNLSDIRCKEYIDDYDVVLAAVRQNGLAIQFASDNLKNNYDIVMEAVKQNGLALNFSSKPIRSLKEICIGAIKQNGLAYDLCSEELFLDEGILGELFMFCLKKNVLENVKKLPTKQKDLFSSIYTGNIAEFLKSPYDFMKSNKSLVISLLKKENNVTNIDKLFGSLPEDFKNDKEIFQLFLERSPKLFLSIPKLLENDKDLVMLAIRNNLEYLKNISEKLQKDETFLLDCIKEFGLKAIEVYLSDKSKKLPQIKKLLYQKNREQAILNAKNKGVLDNGFLEDKEIVRLALGRNPHLLKDLSERFRGDQKVVWVSLKQDIYCFRYVSDKLLDNRNFITDCIQEFGFQNLVKMYPQLQTNNVVVKYQSQLDEISLLKQEVVSLKKELKDLKKIQEEYLAIEDLLGKYISLCDIVKKLIPDIKLYIKHEHSYHTKLALAATRKFPIFSSARTKQTLETQRYNDWKTAELEKNLMADKIRSLIPTQKDLIGLNLTSSEKDSFSKPLSGTSLKNFELFVANSVFKVKELEQKKRNFEQRIQDSDFYKQESFFEKQISIKEASIIQKEKLLNSK